MNNLYQRLADAYWTVQLLALRARTHWHVRFKFEPRDCWIGCFWTPDQLAIPVPLPPVAAAMLREKAFETIPNYAIKYVDCFRVYLIALPMFPLVITYVFRPEELDDAICLD